MTLILSPAGLVPAGSLTPAAQARAGDAVEEFNTRRDDDLATFVKKAAVARTDKELSVDGQSKAVQRLAESAHSAIRNDATETSGPFLRDLKSARKDRPLQLSDVPAWRGTREKFDGAKLEIVQVPALQSDTFTASDAALRLSQVRDRLLAISASDAKQALENGARSGDTELLLAVEEERCSSFMREQVMRHAGLREEDFVRLRRVALSKIYPTEFATAAVLEEILGLIVGNARTVAKQLDKSANISLLQSQQDLETALAPITKAIGFRAA